MGQKKVCTLMYHDVYDTSNQESGFNIDSNYPYKLHVTEFESQISAIRSYLSSHNIDSGYVQLSFDDGGVSLYTIVMPILEKYCFKGYFFIATEYIGQDGFLTESMIKEMAERGHIIGGHSHTHRQRMNDLPFDDLKEDWKRCLAILSDITGNPCVTASLPNGYISKTICQLLREFGISQLYTSNPSEEVIEDGTMEVYGRYGIRNTMSLDDVLGITFIESSKRMLRRKKALLNFAKKLMGRYYIKLREIFFKNK